MNAYIFDVFQPKSKSEPLPSYFTPDFDDIADESAKALARLSPEIIIICTRYFDDYIHSQDKAYTQSSETIEKDGDSEGDYCGGLHGRYLRRIARSQISIEEAFGRPQIKLFEAFAIVAQAYVAMAVRMENILEKTCNQEEVYWRMARYAIEGAKYAYTASTLKLNPDIELPETTIMNYRQRISSKGGKAKNIKFQPLKVAVRNLWEEKYRNQSNREAARRIWQELPDSLKTDKSGRKIIMSPEPEITLEKWIGKF